MIDFSKIDKTSFSTAGYVRRVDKPWGYELHFVHEGLSYMGKIIHIFAGKRLSLQVHDQKHESWMLMHGQARVIWENKSGQLVETELEEGKGYTCALGQKHRLVGVTDCDIIEVSTPEVGTTYRLEDDYKRTDETEEVRAEERKNG